MSNAKIFRLCPKCLGILSILSSYNSVSRSENVLLVLCPIRQILTKCIFLITLIYLYLLLKTSTDIYRFLILSNLIFFPFVSAIFIYLYVKCSSFLIFLLYLSIYLSIHTHHNSHNRYIISIPQRE